MTGEQDDVETWITAGVYDPAAPDAAERLDLLRFFKERDVPLAEIQRQHAEGHIDRAAADHVLRVDRTLTSEEIAARCGMEAADVDRVWLAIGHAAVPLGVPGFSEADVPVLLSFAFARDLFDLEAALQFTRVMGTSLARIADAAVSAFMLNVEDPMRSQTGRTVDIARAGVEGLEGLVLLPQLLQQMFHRHLEAAIARTRELETGVSGVFIYSVGFVDLVGFTAWAETMSLSELASAMSAFENAASARSVAGNARVVKTIGDAVMFVAADPVDACRAALDIVDDVRRHDLLTTARGAVAHGNLLSRDGDFFGPTVNLAARATKIAEPGQVVTTAATPSAAGLTMRPIGAHALRGVAEPTELFVVGNGD